MRTRKNLILSVLSLSLASIGATGAASADVARDDGASAPAPAAGPVDVVGGTVVKPHAWPDAVAVLAPTAACTGTLIAPDVVLTAGHCIETAPRVVIVDTVDYAASLAGGGGGEAIAVTKAIAYPRWQEQYDVGVLVLAHPARSAPRLVARGCNATRRLVDGAKVHLVGFGLTTRAGKGENSVLHEADLPVTDARCEGEGCAAAVSPGGEFMAGGHGTDSCFGDSGGPVYLPTAHGPALIGVVSRGVSRGGLPCGGGGIYVRADQVVGWVEEVTGRTIAQAACDGKPDDPGAAVEVTEPASGEGGGCSAAGAGAGAGLAGVLGAVIAVVLGAPGRRRRQAAA